MSSDHNVTMHNKILLSSIMALSFLAAAGHATAQGFPGVGGGHGMGSRGMRPHGDMPPAQRPAAAPQNPLVAFLGGLRALRTELLVREEQVNAWTGMQDALVAVAEAERDAAKPNTSGDAAAQLRSFADDLGRRADATKAASDRIATVLAALDDHQKQVFLTRLSDAFAGGGAAP